MAASESNRAVEEGESASTEKRETNGDFWAGLGPIVRREPVVKLLSPVSGLEALTWSEDHRLAVSTVNSVSVMELVGPEDKVKSAKQKFENSDDPSVRQVFLLDRVINPQGGALRGMKYTSWSPLGCDENGRCVLACLTLDCRLTVQSCHKRLRWTQVLNLTELYGDMLKSRNYSNGNASETLQEDLEDFEVLQSRYQMQTPVRMEWSSLCNTQQIQSNNECKNVGTVLLAVLMENGDLVVWQFCLPIQGKESVISCNTIKSDVSSPSVLAWWEYEHSGRKMSGLIVGSTVGPVKILPVNLKAVKGYFTLRQPVVLWQDTDNIPVNNIKCVTLFHPAQKCNCSLVVATRGPYVFWCLLLISKAGLNVHNSHVTGLHSTPITSLSITYNGKAVYTSSLDGTVKRLTPVFTDTAIVFKQQEVELPEGVRGCRLHGIASSPNGGYMAVATTEGMLNGLHPVVRTNLVQFITLMTPDEAGAKLLESQVQSLYKQVDLLDLLRWRVMNDKKISQFLQEELDEKTSTSNSMYLWRLKLFLLRVLYQSLQKVPVEARWRPTHEDSKAFLPDDTEGEPAEASTADCSVAADTSEMVETNTKEAEGATDDDERISEITAWIEEVESHLTREHMKKVLGEVYMHTVITENTSIPAKGICDFLSSDPTNDDRAAKVLIGHIMKKMNKQTFPEYCSLCKEVLPFTDRKQAVCSHGHIWLRCVRSFQVCQSVTYRRCLLQDSIASVPQPEAERGKKFAKCGGETVMAGQILTEEEESISRREPWPVAMPWAGLSSTQVG
ncbi:General transcription factor 3C polypeptide 4 [Bagarius yarrelli]|uniref:General transcription factor 3C polypeptide 4 n=1 Tax=Bagarius yarrelli TaxID=175774 RepID=A0A556TUH3_BAGYA|nr:General transcription factor 3C polypeptide 4 [Bagarius yarrelli]